MFAALFMKKPYSIIFVFPVFLLILSILKIVVLSGCANIIPPTGGLKDSLPPVLVKVSPPDSSKNFKDKTITFTFDEYVELQELQTNLLISPTPNISPIVESKLKTITVKIKDSLETNTTYSYDFGKSIKDYTEGNVLKNFSYIFSTGNVIDSLELSGKVILAETGKSDSTLIVILHKNPDDSAIIKDRPRYITKLDSSGNFRFRFLPSGIFHLYALKDDGGTHRYFSKTQLFAFADKPVETKPGLTPVTLYAYTEKKGPSAFVAPLPLNRGAAGRTDERRLKFTTSIIAAQQDILSNFSISFETPFRSFDSSKLQLSTDSTFIKETAYSWETDSLKKKIQLNVKWKENTRYNIILEKDFAADTSGRKLLKTDTLTFTTKKLSDYGAVKISFNKLDLSVNPVLQFIQAEIIINSFPLSTPEFYQPLFIPGEYELRILNDLNKNGKWDAGDFFGKRIQPETVKPIEKKITIKANWDNEYEITL